MNRTVHQQILRLEGRNRTLEIESEVREHTAILKLRGAITAELQDDFLDEILAFVSVGKKIELNFEGVEHIANTAQKKLIELQSDYIEKAALDMEISHVPEAIYRMFRQSRLDTQLRIKRDE